MWLIEIVQFTVLQSKLSMLNFLDFFVNACSFIFVVLYFYAVKCAINDHFFGIFYSSKTDSSEIGKKN